jgi:ABC-type sugar transport system ATPase subunit
LEAAATKSGPIEVRGLVKAYGHNVVLEGIDLTIEPGEFLVLVGPSGCGKSTLLRCIAGLETITAGDLYIDGARSNDVHPKDRDLAMVFQSYALYPHMTVAENLAFSLTVRKLKRPEIERRVAEAAERLGLSDLMGRLPKQLSGGQRQRVAVGRAIVRQPRAFLFDEPLSNLDAQLRGEMRIELKRLHQELGVTMIYVTHDQVEAMTLADRITVLEGGRLQQVGAPAELFERPDNAFVAGFIGSPTMNFLPAELDTSGPRVIGEGFELALPEGYGALDHRGEVAVGIRPTALKLKGEACLVPTSKLNDEGPASLAARATQDGTTMSTMSGVVDVVETLGFEAYLHVKVGGVEVVAQVPANELRGLASGDRVGLIVDPADLHLFAGPSGEALRPPGDAP